MEFELIDTGIFDEDRYRCRGEYAKGDVDDVLMRTTVHNRGPEDALIYLSPSLVPQRVELGAWLQQTVTEGSGRWAGARSTTIWASIPFNSKRRIACCSATTRAIRSIVGVKTQGHFKDAFHDYVIHDRRGGEPCRRRYQNGRTLSTHGACPRQYCRSRARAGEHHPTPSSTWTTY
jgi:hypothetical protein